MNCLIGDQDVIKLIDRLTQAARSEEPLSASERDHLFNATLETLNTMAAAPFGEERRGYVKDFCAAYDDLGLPIKSLLTSSKIGLCHDQKQQIASIFIRRYFSHAPGGRTAIVKALVDQDATLIPVHLVDPLVKRATNATLDRSFLPPWGKHVELLGKLLEAIARDNFELQGIIQLRLEELSYDDRLDIQKISKEVFAKWQWLKIDPDKSSSDFLKRWKFVLLLVEEEKSVTELFTALEDESPWVRSAAALAFGFKRGALASARMLEHLAHDVDEYVRLRCAWAIGQTRDGSVFWPLIQLRKRETVYCVRFAIVEAIAQLDPDKSMELLLDDLGDDNPSIRLFGAEDIRKIRWPKETNWEAATKMLMAVEKVEPLLSVWRAASETLTWAHGAASSLT